MENYISTLKAPSRRLRSNQTPAEQALWQRIRKKQLNGLPFYRQKPLLEYIVDFYCPAAKLVIEIDGDYHNTAEQHEKDQHRDQRLTALGLKVLRFTNTQVERDIEMVLKEISP